MNTGEARCQDSTAPRGSLGSTPRRASTSVLLLFTGAHSVGVISPPTSIDTPNQSLGLVALVAIFLAGIGSAHLFRAYLARRVKDIAILVSLGATRGRAQRVYLLKLCLLSAIAAALACGVAALLAGLVPLVAGDLLPAGFELRIGLRTVALVVLLSVLGSAVACLPLLARLRELRPAELFAEHVQPRLGRGPRDALWLAPALAAFYAVAVWRVGSLLVGSVFVAVFFGSLAALAVLGLVGLRALAALPTRGALAGGKGRFQRRSWRIDTPAQSVRSQT